MNVLELDAGNSRLKWRLVKYTGGNPGVLGGGAVTADEDAGVVQRLMEQLPDAPQRVLVSSVRSAGFRSLLAERMQQVFALQPEFAVSRKRCAGLEVVYAEPGRLGVDRWLAMLAAYKDSGRACCVIDCGTTITMDAIGADGRHLGGYIVPGLKLMQQALSARSTALVPATSPPVPVPGVNTGEAISHGVLTMALGFIAEVKSQLSKLEMPERWIFCGGDAEILVPYLQWPVETRPDLVLDGLRLAFTDLE